MGTQINRRHTPLACSCPPTVAGTSRLQYMASCGEDLCATSLVDNYDVLGQGELVMEPERVANIHLTFILHTDKHLNTLL